MKTETLPTTGQTWLRKNGSNKARIRFVIQSFNHDKTDDSGWIMNGHIVTAKSDLQKAIKWLSIPMEPTGI